MLTVVEEILLERGDSADEGLERVSPCGAEHCYRTTGHRVVISAILKMVTGPDLLRFITWDSCQLCSLMLYNSLSASNRIPSCMCSDLVLLGQRIIWTG